MGAAAAPIAIGASVVGAGFSIYGQKKAEKAEKQALAREKEIIQEQRVFLRQQKAEKLEIMEEEADELFGNQASAFAANNVSLSGSALSMAINDQMKAERAQRQVESEFDFNIKMGGFRQEAIDRNIASINSQSNWKTATTILGAAGDIYSTTKYMGGK